MSTRKPKLLIIGHGRHGKDALCEILQNRYGFRFISSSQFVLEKAVWPTLKAYYSSMDECFDDRHSRRADWFRLISKYNKRNAARLGSELFAQYDIYCGLRSARELHAMKMRGVYDCAVWVDRSEHCPPEPRSSCTVEPWMADFVLDNNGTLSDLERNIEVMLKAVTKRLGVPAMKRAA